MHLQKIMELKPRLFHFFAELQAIWKESKIYLTENRKRTKKKDLKMKLYILDTQWIMIE
jgi:hypothetical protein